MLYPLIFKPIYKEMIWGGNRFTTVLDRGVPSGHIGESWDISCRPDEMSIVANGINAGKKFIDLINTDKEKYLGKSLCDNRNFPLLVKIIDASEDLSVQVHPTDEYAREHENAGLGKSEIWYVLEAPVGGELIVGVKQGLTLADFKTAIESGNTEDCLNRLSVEQGDVVYIPAGLVHALTKGSMVAEIQQNSDITYRLYDYGRLGEAGKPRTLHIDKALDVINFDGKNNNARISGSITGGQDCEKTHYIADKYFSIDKYKIFDSYTECSDPDRFFIFTCVEGDCEINSYSYCMDIKKGESVFIPASLGEYTFKGECSLIKSYVPNAVFNENV